MFNAHRVGGPYNDVEYPYADTQGFGLTFVGGDVSYLTDQGGVTIGLRWGPNVDRLTQLAPISLGYATWIPVERLTLDFGFFDAFIGIETQDEWLNPTFTRGVIYFNMQPFRHLGFRASYAAHKKVDLTLIIARGDIFGLRFDSPRVRVPAVGAQVVYRPTSVATLKLGGVGSPNGSSGNRDWQAIFDVIAMFEVKDWTLDVDVDVEFSPNGPLTGKDTQLLWGVNVSGTYEFTEAWSFGFRCEYLGGDEGSVLEDIVTITATVRYKPVEFLVISLEPRAELSTEDIFFSRPFVSDPTTGNTVATVNQDWFFGFWIGATAHLGN